MILVRLRTRPVDLILESQLASEAFEIREDGGLSNTQKCKMPPPAVQLLEIKVDANVEESVLESKVFPHLLEASRISAVDRKVAMLDQHPLRHVARVNRDRKSRQPFPLEGRGQITLHERPLGAKRGTIVFVLKAVQSPRIESPHHRVYVGACGG